MKNIDYRSFNKPNIADQNPNHKQWWKAREDEMAQAICSTVKTIAEFDSKRQTQYQISNRLYGNYNVMGLNGFTFAKTQSVQGAVKDRLTYNVCQSVVDTLTSKITKNKPRPLFLTSGGNMKMQRKAQKLQKFIDGVFYENKAYDLGTTIFRDSLVSGDGIIHVFKKNGRVKFERVIASELYVDWVDGFYGEPRQIHRVKNIDRLVLMDMFPDHKNLISTANAATAELLGVAQNVSDQITVVESWHLPSGEDANDGEHVICIAEGLLFKEEWKKSYFPFAKLGYSDRLYGYWAQGLVEQTQNIQLEINKILWLIQRSFHLAGTFKILIENGSKIVKEHVNNDLGTIVNYSGTPPQYVVPQIVPVEMYTQLLNLKSSAYEQAGISQLSASSMKPEGLDSGKALREYNNIETDRFMVTGHKFENLFLNLAALSIDVAKEIYQDDRGFSVKVPGSKFIQSIKWSEVDMAEDEYVLKMFPVSSLPNEPAGRLQTVQEYIQAGFINPRTGRKLLDFPDLEQVEDLANAEEEYLNGIFEKMIDDGEFTPPEPYDDLGLARELALQYYAQGKQHNLEEEKLDLIRRFMDQLDVLEGKTAEALAASAPMSPQPQAVPEQPPVSPLLPNVPAA